MSSDVMISPYASLGRRFVAWLLDLMILLIPCAIGSHLLPVLGGVVVLFFYAPILECSEIRATLGKHLMGIQVSDLTGRRISLRASVIRNVLKYVSSIFLFIGFFFALFTQKKQTLHDLLADTLVVYGRSERPIVDAWTESVREVFKSQSSSPSSVTGESEFTDKLSRLERLQALKDKGTLSEEEFEREKKRILS